MTNLFYEYISIILMIQGGQGETSRLLILSNCQKNAALLKAVLSKYFHLSSQNILHLTTKYYKAEIQTSVEVWPTAAQLGKSQSQNQVSQQNKHDLLIMLVGQQENFSAEIYDFAITKYNPENFILLVNTTNKEEKWKDQELIASQVNNFIEIIKENLESLSQNPPQREKAGLLADNFQEGSIFSLLQLIQTTQWCCIQRLNQPKKTIKPQLAVVTTEKQTLAPKAGPAKAQTKQQNAQKAQYQKQPTQQELQQQMLSFQSMIKDMMAMKEISQQPQGVADNERKQKAEDLINRLLKGNFI